MKILIVDDDRTTAALLLTYLSQSGKCSVVNSGEEALDTIKDAMERGNPYDLICLDILLPTIDGLETLRTIREFEQSTYNVSGKISKIIMISALDDIKTIQRAFRELCDGYLTKPVKKEDLLEKINEVWLET